MARGTAHGAGSTMTDITERQFYNDLDNDAAGDWTPVTDAHAPCFDEWNALRLSQGQRLGSFTEYMREIAPLLADDRNQW